MRGLIKAPPRPGGTYNLLDNSNFSNPINQREQVSYTGNMIGIDRWTAWSKSGKLFVGLEDGCIRVWNGDTEGGTFGQKFPQGTFSSTKPYTFAYKRTDGKIYIQNNPIENYPEYGFQAVNIPLASNQTHIIVWAALYEGEYTADTLPPYVPKGYAMELAECQRYFYRFDGIVAACWPDSATALRAWLPIAGMRATPTIASATIDWIMYANDGYVQSPTHSNAYIQSYSPSGALVKFEGLPTNLNVATRPVVINLRSAFSADL